MNERGFTERMVSALEKLQDEFVNIYCKEDFDVKLNNLRRAKNTSGWPGRLNELYALLDDCGINYEQNRETEYYERLVNEEKIPSFEDLAGIMVSALFEKFLVYPRPEEYMERMIDRLGSDDWSNDTVRVRILKQFVKYGNCLTYQSEDNAGNKTETVKIYGGETYLKKYLKEKLKKKVERVADELDAICDDIFDVLDSATKEQKKPTGTYGILKMVDDLACGKFRVGGATKKSLYLFAMVYGMTYYSGGNDKSVIVDPDSDIEKNLFQDYYVSNTMRFLTDYFRNNLFEYEIDPSGRGINYKNFAEVIYLYYISQDCEPAVKIRKSNEMIKRIQKKQYQKKESKKTEDNRGTRYYRSLVRPSSVAQSVDSVLDLPEQEFEKFISENYNCDTYAEGYAVGEMQLEEEQNSALLEYERILEKLEDLRIPPKECNYGLYFTDVRTFRENGFKLIHSINPDADEKIFEDFADLLTGMNSFMVNTVVRGDSNKHKSFYVPSSSEVTRTMLMVLYYYYYNALHESDRKDRWMNFRELYSDFKNNIDEVLENAYYMPLSSKNVFDVFVVFSSYIYLNT